MNIDKSLNNAFSKKISDIKPGFLKPKTRLPKIITPRFDTIKGRTIIGYPKV